MRLWLADRHQLDPEAVRDPLHPPRSGGAQLRASLLALLLMVGAAALVFHLFQRQLRGASFAFGAHPEVLGELVASLDDLKHLADLDPAGESVYRERFAGLEKIVHRLQILEHNRDQLAGRYESLLLLVFAVCVVLTAGIYVVRQSRHEPRLARLQKALTGLAEGRTDLELGDRSRDAIGRIAAMIERTSQRMARDRQRLAALKNLSSWQEAARRQAHEMRTPLTSARLELSRVEDLLRSESCALGKGAEILRASESARQELDRLGKFTQRFTSFARLPQPELKRLDLTELLREFVATYGSAWKNLRLDLAAGEPTLAFVDRDMLRQVLVNLCDNSSLSLGDSDGEVGFCLAIANGSIHLDVTDDGPGIDEAIRPRLFEPYMTTRTLGQGMGLGLAISKKILLDHGGDLELVATSESGSTFRLMLPQPGGEVG